MKIASAGELHGRSVEEWIGKTPDERPPDRVRMRVLLRYNRRCYWTGVLIRPGDEWDCDHIIAIINGGQNRESNLAPIWRGKAHKEKTKQDREEADRVKSLQRGHYGLRPKSQWQKKADVLARMARSKGIDA